MILYLGTSSLIKLYIEEKYSDIVRKWVDEAEIVATCRIAYTEALSALDIRLKRNDLSKKDYKLVVSRLTKDWIHFATVDFDEIVAGRLVKKYGLRRFDAIHLSTAKLMKSKQKDVSLYFSSFHKILCQAAMSEGIRVLTAG